MVAAPSSSSTRPRLPVTLLSGFLGAGKTTLLEYILKSKDHGLKCAVIVNDMGALNIDAALLSNHKMTQKEETVVQMQNGCICCTLRSDLLEEVANLAEAGEFDCLLIESTGISEPIQVAETFTTEFAESLNPDDVDAIEASLPPSEGQTPESRQKIAALIAAGGLSKVARLDCCVSVVDCTTFMDDFSTTDFLTDRHGDQVTPEDERNITDLLVDQIEFANVILLNKIDVCSAEQVKRVETLVKTLNPGAKVFPTTRSRVPLKEILDTNLFDFEKAATGAGWLQSLKEDNMITHVAADGSSRRIPKPETIEYGITSFVYRERRPFHPERLWELMSKPFAVIQTSFDAEEDESDEEEDSDEGSDADDDDDEPEMTVAETLAEEKAALDLPARAKYKREHPVWKTLLRSKGFCWLATRNDVFGEWSQAGIMFTLTGGGRWLCTEPEESWPMAHIPSVKAAIKKDFHGAWGDRRQELVFIGENLDHDKLKAQMDACLLNDKEWAKWQRIMKSKKSDEVKEQALLDTFEDGWEDWADPMEDMDEQEAVTPPPVVEAPKSKGKGKAAADPIVVTTPASVMDHSGHKHSSKNKKQKLVPAA